MARRRPPDPRRLIGRSNPARAAQQQQQPEVLPLLCLPQRLWSEAPPALGLRPTLTADRRAEGRCCCRPGRASGGGRRGRRLAQIACPCDSCFLRFVCTIEPLSSHSHPRSLVRSTNHLFLSHTGDYCRALVCTALCAALYRLHTTVRPGYMDMDMDGYFLHHHQDQTHPARAAVTSSRTLARHYDQRCQPSRASHGSYLDLGPSLRIPLTEEA